MAMRWEDERYVRVYTRDTVEWEMLCWQARALMPLILRKVDRAGLLELGKHGARGLAASVNAPIDFVTAGLNGDDGKLGLVESGAVELRGEMLIVPNFIAAQETPSSDAQRKRDQREKAAGVARLESQNVTECHAESRAVTDGHSVPSDPSLPIRTDIPAASAGPVDKPNRKPRKTRPRWDDVTAAYSDSWLALHSLSGQRPAIDGPDIAGLARVYDAHGIEETITLIQRFVSDTDPHITKRGHILRDLPSRVNAYRAKTAVPQLRFQQPRDAVPEGQGGKIDLAAVLGRKT